MNKETKHAGYPASYLLFRVAYFSIGGVILLSSYFNEKAWKFILIPMGIIHIGLATKYLVSLATQKEEEWNFEWDDETISLKAPGHNKIEFPKRKILNIQTSEDWFQFQVKGQQSKYRIPYTAMPRDLEIHLTRGEIGTGVPNAEEPSPTTHTGL